MTELTHTAVEESPQTTPNRTPRAKASVVKAQPVPEANGVSEFRDIRVEKWLYDHGVGFSLVMLDLNEVNRAESQRNQARFTALSQETVGLYEAAIRAGDIFPPIVVYRLATGYVVMDGNHRVAGYDLVGIHDVSAYVVADPSEAQVLTLTYEANTKHGLPTSQEERIGQALLFVAKGMTQPQVTKMLGLPTSVLKIAVERERARLRFDTLGILRRERLSPSMLTRLDNIRSDEVLRAAASLVIETGMRMEDVSELVKTVNKARSSEKAQLAIIERERETKRGVIKATAAGRVRLPQQVTTLLRATSTLNRLGKRQLSESLHGVPSELRGDIVRSCAESVDVLMRITRELRNT